MSLKSANLALRFLLELCALTALAVWGFQTGEGLLMKIVLGIGIPLLGALAWGTFRVPNDPGRAPVPVPGPFRLVLEVVIFGLATASLAAAGHPSLALVFGLAVVINNALMYDRLIWLWRQR